MPTAPGCCGTTELPEVLHAQITSDCATINGLNFPLTYDEAEGWWASSVHQVCTDHRMVLICLGGGSWGGYLTTGDFSSYMAFTNGAAGECEPLDVTLDTYFDGAEVCDCDFGDAVNTVIHVTAPVVIENTGRIQFSPGRCCCPAECPMCEGITPNILLEIDGIANDECATGCDELNGVYVLRYRCGGCFWIYEIDQANPCNNERVTNFECGASDEEFDARTPYLQILLRNDVNPFAAFFNVTLFYANAGSGVEFIAWHKGLFTFDFCQWDEIELDGNLGPGTPPGATDDSCDVSAATAKIKSMP